MKSSRHAPSRILSFRGGISVFILALLLPVASLDAQVMDFNDGSDTGIYRYDPIALSGGGTTGSWTFPNGNTYRIQSGNSPNPVMLGPGRAASVFAGISYTDFYVSVDLVNWNNTLNQAIGIMARVTHVGPGSTDGYSMSYQPTEGDITLARVTNESPEGGTLEVIPLVLTAGHRYSLIFSGVGPALRARVLDLTQPGPPLIDVTTTDATYPAGDIGLIVFSNTADGSGTADATFDNYRASAVESPPLSLSRQAGVDVDWTVDAAYYVLQARAGMTSGNWVDIPPPYTVMGTRFIHQEMHPLPGPARFYRLILP